MIDHLAEPTEDHPDPRSDLDAALGVDNWARIGAVYVARPPEREEEDTGAPPPWWRGEEEASESFMAAMNIRIDESGQVIRR
jgi:hypothetical protein